MSSGTPWTIKLAPIHPFANMLVSRSVQIVFVAKRRQNVSIDRPARPRNALVRRRRPDSGATQKATALLPSDRCVARWVVYRRYCFRPCTRLGHDHL